VGLVVIGLAVLLVAVVAGLRPQLVTGAAQSTPIPRLPAVGDCVVDRPHGVPSGARRDDRGSSLMPGRTDGANRFGAAAAKRTGPTPTPGSDGEVVRKYTILLSTTIANGLDEDVLNIRRKVGKKVDKSEVMRILIGMLHDDPTLSDAITARLTK